MNKHKAIWEWGELHIFDENGRFIKHTSATEFKTAKDRYGNELPFQWGEAVAQGIIIRLSDDDTPYITQEDAETYEPWQPPVEKHEQLLKWSLRIFNVVDRFLDWLHAKIIAAFA